MRGWPLFRRGLVVFAAGAIITVLTFVSARSLGGFYVISLAPVSYGLIDMARGLRRPLSERRPWLFAAPPFGTNPDGSVSSPEPGWHPDPMMNQAVQRWYDGQTWTEDTRKAPAQA